MTDLRTLKCTCKAPPGKHDSGRQRRRCTHDLECELVVYVERLERLRDGAGDLARTLLDVRGCIVTSSQRSLERIETAIALLSELQP